MRPMLAATANASARVPAHVRARVSLGFTSFSLICRFFNRSEKRVAHSGGLSREQDGVHIHRPLREISSPSSRRTPRSIRRGVRCKSHCSTAFPQQLPSVVMGPGVRRDDDRGYVVGSRLPRSSCPAPVSYTHL